MAKHTLQCSINMQRVESDEGPKTYKALAVPAGATSNDWRAIHFAADALDWTDKVPVFLDHGHTVGTMAGQTSSFALSDAGVECEFSLVDTTAGRDAAKLIEDGLLTGVSIGFQTDDFEHDEIGIKINHATIYELSLVWQPALDNARIMQELSTSLEIPTNSKETHMPETPAAPAELVLSSAAMAALGAAIGEAVGTSVTQAVEALSTSTTTAVVPTAVVTERPSYGAGSQYSLVQDLSSLRPDIAGVVPEGAHTRIGALNASLATGKATLGLDRHGIIALAPQTQADQPVLIPTGRREDMFQDLLFLNSPLAASVTRVAISDSRPFTIPKATGYSGLVAAHVEGTNPTAGTITTGTQTITPGSVSGAYDLTRELMTNATPAVDGIVLRAMQESYNELLEARVQTILDAVPAANTGPGAVVEVTTDEVDLIKAIKRQLALGSMRRGGSRLNTGVIPTEILMALIDAEDDNRRPLIGGEGNINDALGSADFASSSVTIRGQRFTGAWALDTNDYGYLFNRSSVLLFQSPVQGFKFEEVSGPANIRLAMWGLVGQAVVRDYDVTRFAYNPA